MKKSLLLLNFLAFSISYLFAQTGAFTSTSFMPKMDLTTGMYPHCVVLADFNGDGKTDLFVSKGSSSTNSVFRNGSTGGNISFTQQLDLGNSGIGEEGAAAGDLDGDGKPDIVVSNGVSAASISIYRNTTTGLTISFAAKTDLAVINGPYAVAIGDLDGDGKPDIAVANDGVNLISKQEWILR